MIFQRVLKRSVSMKVRGSLITDDAFDDLTQNWPKSY